MIYRTYGSSNIQVSNIGFGGMRFDDRKGFDENAALVYSAYENDINYFDTAPGYGDSEKIFGAAFKEMKATRSKKPFFVSTKTSKSKIDEVLRDLESSLVKMGLDYVDFYYIWSVLSLDDYNNRKRNGVLESFDRLKQEGLVKHVCISTHMNGNDIEELIKDYSFDGILMGYSVMNFTYREAGLSAASKKNMGIAVMNPLGGGVIPQNPDRFQFIKTQRDETVVEGAIRFLLNDSRISVSLIGISNQQELQAALKTVEEFKPISNEKIETIKKQLNTAMNELCTSCQYCDSCSENIPITKMMEAYNQILLTGKSELLIDRLQWHWDLDPMNLEHFNRCTECGQCEELCTQKLPIRDRMRAILKEVVQYRSSRPKKELAVHRAKSLLRNIRSSLRR